VVFYIGAILVLAISYARAELTEEQRRVPLEVEGAGAKIVLLAGSPSNKAGQHEYFAGCALMMDWLRQASGVAPVLAADGWPKNEAILNGTRAVVVYADGGAKLPFLADARWAKMRALIEGGAGFVMLHQAVDLPAPQADEMKRWLGAVWQPDIGSRGHWDMSFADFPKHPTLRGVTAFEAPLDGWLYNLHFAPGAVPLLSGAVPDKSRTTEDAKAHTGRAEVIAWSFERPGGGRSFAFTRLRPAQKLAGRKPTPLRDQWHPLERPARRPRNRRPTSRCNPPTSGKTSTRKRRRKPRPRLRQKHRRKRCAGSAGIAALLDRLEGTVFCVFRWAIRAADARSTPQKRSSAKIPVARNKSHERPQWLGCQLDLLFPPLLRLIMQR
jgi:hypothetical protein